MSYDESLVSEVAHGLLDDLTAIQGLLLTARQHYEANTPRNDRADYLLQMTELRAISLVNQFRHYAWAAPLNDRRDATVVSLDEHRT